MFEKLQSIHKCPLSQEEDNLCIFAQPVENTVHCKLVFGWWHDLDVALHDKCFNLIKNRDRLLWRNRQLRKKNTLRGKI